MYINSNSNLPRLFDNGVHHTTRFKLALKAFELVAEAKELIVVSAECLPFSRWKVVE
jgi:hypothetical protein